VRKKKENHVDGHKTAAQVAISGALTFTFDCVETLYDQHIEQVGIFHAGRRRLQLGLVVVWRCVADCGNVRGGRTAVAGGMARTTFGIGFCPVLSQPAMILAEAWPRSKTVVALPAMNDSPAFAQIVANLALAALRGQRSASK